MVKPDAKRWLEVSEKLLVSLKARFPWSNALAALAIVLGHVPEEVYSGGFLLPTSEANLLENLECRISLSELREWEQWAADAVQVTVADPTYHTSRIHRHPPPRASWYCQENAESHLRCVRVDPSVASYLKDQISAERQSQPEREHGCRRTHD